MSTVSFPAPLFAKPQAVFATSQRAAGQQSSGAPNAPVDVLKFRVLPGAGAPVVSTRDDNTLGKTGPIPWVVNKLSGFGPVGAKIGSAIRGGTRLIGPGMYAYSAYWNIRMLPGVLKDKQLTTGSKVTLVGGTGFVTVGAVGAMVASLPRAFAAKMGLNVPRLMTVNKVSGMFGGVASLGYGAINLVETLRNPTSTPAQRFFAKFGMGLGSLGFVLGTTAMVLSIVSPAAAVLGPFSIAATIAGVVALATNIGQGFLGKNAWLNRVLKGSFLA
jgi:hypothetical protein